MTPTISTNDAGPTYGPCSSCTFARQRAGNGLECRRYPPRPMLVLESTPTGNPEGYSKRAIWPTVTADDGCGEHSPK